MLEGQLLWFPNIAKFEEMFLLILGKRFKKQTHTCNNFAYNLQALQIMMARQSRRNIASNHFICFFLIHQQCKIYKLPLPCFNFQTTIWKKKTLTVKHHEAYPTRMNSPIMWSKKGMITFPVGGSVFCYKIFATSKICVILHNYSNNHKILFPSSHPQRCTATCAYTVNMNQDAHSIV